MIILATKWTTAWLMTGMGIAVVFSILLLLVFVLQIFSKIAEGSETKSKRRVKSVSSVNDIKEQVEGYEEDMAAVATAVYLYQNGAHDQESGVLTIHQDEYSLWHAELNESL